MLSRYRDLRHSFYSSNQELQRTEPTAASGILPEDKCCFCAARVLVVSVPGVYVYVCVNWACGTIWEVQVWGEFPTRNGVGCDSHRNMMGYW